MFSLYKKLKNIKDYYSIYIICNMLQNLLVKFFKFDKKNYVKKVLFAIFVLYNTKYLEVEEI